MRMTTLITGLLFFSLHAFAEDAHVKTFGTIKVYYSAFNSSFVTPNVASAYNITRGKDKGLVNIAVVPAGSNHGATALVGGAVNNLLAQQQTLEFTEIREGEAVYYLAPFRFENEDALTFTIHVRPAGQETTNTFTFKRTLYRD